MWVISDGLPIPRSVVAVSVWKRGRDRESGDCADGVRTEAKSSIKTRLKGHTRFMTYIMVL